MTEDRSFEQRFTPLISLPSASCPLTSASGGANRDRTGDLLLAKQALSQLSYGPEGQTDRISCSPKGGRSWPKNKSRRRKGCGGGGHDVFGS